jgi:serine/threonine-protein kinase
LVHRDVKPENIILREGTDQVVLIDFGIARQFTPGMTETNTGLLSVGYAPLEQYLPRHQWSPATDVYALAATLYALLAGRAPIASVLRDRLPLEDLSHFQPQLNPVLKQAVVRGMALELGYRPATIEAWLRLLPTDLGVVVKEGQGKSTQWEPAQGVNADSDSPTGATRAVLPQLPKRRGDANQQSQAEPKSAPATVMQARQPRPAAGGPPTYPPAQFPAQLSAQRPYTDSGRYTGPAPKRRLGLWLLLTALGASGLGAAVGLYLRSHPVPEWAPPLLRQTETFPPTIPPAQRPPTPLPDLNSPLLSPTPSPSPEVTESPTPSPTLSPDSESDDPLSSPTLSPSPTSSPGLSPSPRNPRNPRIHSPVPSPVPSPPPPATPPEPPPEPVSPPAVAPEPPPEPVPASP